MEKTSLSGRWMAALRGERSENSTQVATYWLPKRESPSCGKGLLCFFCWSVWPFLRYGQNSFASSGCMWQRKSVGCWTIESMWLRLSWVITLIFTSHYARDRWPSFLNKSHFLLAGVTSLYLWLDSSMAAQNSLTSWRSFVNTLLIIHTSCSHMLALFYHDKRFRRCGGDSVRNCWPTFWPFAQTDFCSLSFLNVFDTDSSLDQHTIFDVRARHLAKYDDHR